VLNFQIFNRTEIHANTATLAELVINMYNPFSLSSFFLRH